MPDLILVTPPEPVVSASEAKSLVSSFSDLGNPQIEVLLAAATAQLDGPNGMLMKCIGKQKWRQSYQRTEPLYRLPALGGVTVEKVYSGSDELDAADYTVSADALSTYVASFAQVSSIVFTAGFDDVPQNIKMAIILVAADIQAKVSESAGLRSFEAYQAYTEQYSSPEVISSATMRTIQALIGRYTGVVLA